MTTVVESTPPEPDVLSDLALTHFLSFRIARVHAKLNAQAIALLSANAGITLQQWRVLVFLGEKKLNTASALGRAGEIDKALLSRTIKALIADGLVVDRRDPNDGRQVRLLLTSKGRRLRTRMLPIMKQRQRVLLEALNKTERRLIYGALEKLENVAARTTVGELNAHAGVDHA
ncbi:MAG: MarR family winged helix-turn-helix transcriptional regulator [Pseudomonadota bacterium]